MTITPVRSIDQAVGGIQSVFSQQQGSPSVSFANVFQNLIDNVNQTEAATKQDQLLLASGQVDDLHTVTINAAKAELALDTLVQVRNKALDAYNEIMRISL